ncbi:MAG: cbb3-type cytochrome oxidase assembly protein CcoS [Pseudomonadales bacterium]|nr:cbb3-type cytochrome oxidase assembly protein CcoS [Pseudomonadales bacterium]
MTSLYLIVPIAVLICAGTIGAWWWANHSGQYDDLDREAKRILEEKDTHES